MSRAEEIRSKLNTTDSFSSDQQSRYDSIRRKMAGVGDDTDEKKQIYSAIREKLYGSTDTGKKQQWASQNSGLTYSQVKQRKATATGDELDYLNQYGTLVGYSTLEDYDAELADTDSGISTGYERLTGNGKKRNGYYDRLKRARDQYESAHKMDAYSAILSADDYAEKSVYNPDNASGTYRMLNDSEYRDSQLDAAKNLTTIEMNQDQMTYTMNGYDRMTDEEIGIYNYLYQQSPEKAQQYLDDLKYSIDKRESDQSKVDQEQRAKDGHGVGMTLQRIATQPIANAMTAANAVYGLATGEYNPYSAFASMANTNEDIVNAVSQNIQGSSKYGDALAFLYQTGISTADSMIGAALFGKTYTALMGTSAFQSKFREMTDNGSSHDDALKTSLAAGAAEAAFEYISMDKLLSPKAMTNPGKYMLELLKQAGVEGSEEVNTDLANAFADYVINGGASELSMKYNNYIEQGYSEEEAKKATGVDFAKELAMSFAGGALSGGVSGAAFNGVQYHQVGKQGQQLRESGVADSAAAVASSMGENSDAFKAYSAVLDENGNVRSDANNREIAYAYSDMQDALVIDYNENVKADKQSQKELSYGFDVKSVYDSLDESVKNDIETLSREKAIESIQRYQAEEGFDFEASRSDAERIYDYATTKRVRRAEAPYIASEYTKRAEQRLIDSRSTDAQNRYSKAVKIGVRSVSVENGDVVVKSNDGTETTVPVSNLSDNTAKAVNIASKMEENKQAAFVESFNPRYSAEVNEAAFDAIYECGVNGTDTSIFESASKVLGERGVATAYKAGVAEINARANAIKESTEKAAKNIDGIRAGQFSSDVKYESLSGRKKAKYNVAKLLSSLGINVKVIDDSSEDADNGNYDTKTNTLMFNLSARYYKQMTSKDAGYFMNTVSHEVTHFALSNVDQAVFDEFRQLFIDSMGQQKFDEFCEAHRYDSNGRELSRYEQEQEVIARACEDVLNDPDALIEVLSGGNKDNISKVKQAILDVLDRIKQYFDKIINSISSDAPEAQYIREVSKNLDEIRAAYIDVFNQAITNIQSNEQGLTREEKAEREAGIEVNEESGVVLNSIRMNLSDRWQSLGYKSYEQCIDEVAKDIHKKSGCDIEDIKRWIHAEESIAALIINDKMLETLDYIAAEGEVAIKKNSDYPQGTVDFSNLCRKREIFTRMFDNLQKDNAGHLFTANEIATIRQVLAEKNYEVACALCYVEDRRQKVGEIADTFIEYYKEALESDSKIIKRVNSEGKIKPLKYTKPEQSLYKVSPLPGEDVAYIYADDPYIPTQYDLVTEAGLTALKKEHPTIARAFINYNNARGMASARLILPHAEYKREILKYNKRTVDKINKNGGLRIFSFSDFQAQHLIDLVQIIQDCAVKGVMIQTYTKVPEFAALVRNTGVKLNRSLIPANIGSENAYARDESGKWVKVKPYKDGIASLNGKDVLCFDTVEGIDVNSEYFLDEESSRDIGNILIGISDEQIRLAMNDPFVDYIIPFHTGQTMSVLERKGIAEWSNYKKTQTEKSLLDEEDRKKKGINIYGEVIGKHHVKNVEEFTYWFLQECKNQDFTPRFAEFLTKDENGDYVAPAGYYKLLLDYKLFDSDGNILKQREVVPNFDEAEQYGLIKKILTGGAKRIENLKFDDEIVGTVKERLASEHDVLLKSEKVNDPALELLEKNKALEAENEHLRKDIERLKERLMLEHRETNGGVMKPKHIELAAKSILKTYNSSYDLQELQDRIRGLYQYILDESNGGNIDADRVMNEAYSIASDVVSAQKGTRVKDSYLSKRKSELRNIRFSVTDTQRQELESAYGKNWRNAFMGKFIVAKDARSLESMWSELTEQFPDLFSEDINEAEMPEALLEAYDSLSKAADYIDYYDEAEMIGEVAVNIYDKFWTVDTIRTEKDKASDRIRRINAEHREAINKLKEDRKHRVEQQKLLDDMYYGRVIRNIRKSRDEQIQKLRKGMAESRQKQKDQIERATLIKKITKNADDLRAWMLKGNTKNGHYVSDAIKPAVRDLLDAIDFSSKQLLGITRGMNAYTPTKRDISLSESMQKINRIVADSLRAQTEGEFTLDLPANYDAVTQELNDNIQNIQKKIGADNGYVLQEMDLADLESLNELVKIMKHSVTSMNKLIASRNAHSVDYVAQQTIAEANEIGGTGKSNKYFDAVKKFLTSDMTTPYYFFKNLGSGAREIFTELQDGWDKYSFNVKTIIDYTEKTYSDKEVREWSKQIHDFDILLPITESELAQGKTSETAHIRMTTAQIMSLYCLGKRDQARSHIFQGGIRIDNFTDGMNEVNQALPIQLTESSFDQIISVLTDRQLQVADDLQAFMNTTAAAWGNEISMKRFGIAGFTEENYFPIRSDSNVLATDPRDETQSIYRLLNLSFTKATVDKASNQILVSDIFSVFANHTADMAKYNSIALPVLDTIKWFNYKEKENVGTTQEKVTSLKTTLESVYGKQVLTYINHYLQDMNGVAENGRGISLQMKFLKNYKTAAVAANIQVAMLQPISYIRASYVMDAKYLMSGFKGVAHLKHQIEKCKDTCGMAYWKSLGFYDTNINRGLDTIIRHDESFKDKVIEKSLILAEKADEFTWGIIYTACESEISEKTSLVKGSEEFEKAVSDRFREVIYATQVVDSTMTRSDIMRSRNDLAKLTTAFMAEPTVSYNTMLDAYTMFERDLKKSKNFGQAFSKNGKNIANCINAYVLSVAAESLIRSVVSSWRNPDDDEEFIEKFIDTLKEQMNILNSIPFVKDILSAITGDTVSRMDVAGFNYVSYAYSAWKKYESGKGTLYKAVYRTLQAVGSLSGIPTAAPFRDIVGIGNAAIGIWNATIGKMYPNLKIEE